MKANHKQKLKIARKMGIFNSQWWELRKKAIADRVERKIIKIKKAIKLKNLKEKQ